MGGLVGITLGNFPCRCSFTYYLFLRSPDFPHSNRNPFAVWRRRNRLGLGPCKSKMDPSLNAPISFRGGEKWLLGGVTWTTQRLQRTSDETVEDCSPAVIHPKEENYFSHWRSRTIIHPNPFFSDSEGEGGSIASVKWKRGCQVEPNAISDTLIVGAPRDCVGFVPLATKLLLLECYTLHVTCHGWLRLRTVAYRYSTETRALPTAREWAGGRRGGGWFSKAAEQKRACPGPYSQLALDTAVQ